MCCNCEYVFIGNFQVLLRKEAAKKLKEETDAAMAERRKVIEKRVGQPKKLEGLSDGNNHDLSYMLILTFSITFSQLILDSKTFLYLLIGELRALCKEYHQRICMIEDKKYDLEQEVDKKDYTVRKQFQNIIHQI